ncbi:serine/threonine-protein kinase [Parvularcula marina]|uniref:Serine/threonine protein kinase n=1 Tax=Parvularcula marina TaxID=2292771 RepID=A0A371R7X0_9PROT|nr:serine/threonine-protein kinase [Parvularcula marina]RFB01529.1 serine/threonine protein kinase [Parvularcula marina]
MADNRELEIEAMKALEEAFDKPEADRESWAKTRYSSDPALLTRVLKLLKTDASMSMALRTGGARDALEDEVSPERAGQYRITDLIGRGGMGAVYIAERDAGDFDHKVAVKIIRPGVLSDVLIGRFETERQILASLNHPNIARLFDGGTLTDGSPYIVMEYVDGIPISEWVRKKDLSLEARLEVFCEVCSAVEHAHQNLIIHRDITPTNVLVTKDGAVKLIDFGIAKPQVLEDDVASAAQKAIDSRTYTPGFAAPERMEGAPTNTLSDVYSLGKLLAAMLGGLTIPQDVSAIIAKATRTDPADRYRSVLALFEDVENFLSGHSVEARGGGRFYRFGKYFHRHWLAVSVSSLAAIGLIIAFAVTLFQYQRAETALDSANARFEQARSLSRSLIFDTYDEFEQVAGTLEPRRKLANLVSDYVDDLAGGENVPNDILFDIGTMSMRLANLYGAVGLANLGDTEKSEELLLKAEVALEKLLADEPTNTKALAELAMVKRNLSMQHLLYNEDIDMAARYNAEVLDMAAKGTALGDENERTLLRHFWSGRTDRLQILYQQEDYETALNEVQSWRAELDDEMFERLGGGEEMAAYMAMQEGELLIDLGRPAEAVAPLGYARAYRLGQLQGEPDNYYQKTQLLTASMIIARAHTAAGDLEAALEANGDALTAARELFALDTEDAGGPEGLNKVLQDRVLYLNELGRHDEAREAASEAVDLAALLDEKFPQTPYYQRLLVDSYLTQAGIPGSPALSCRAIAEARALNAQLGTGVINGGEEKSPETDEKIAGLEGRLNCNI